MKSNPTNTPQDAVERVEATIHKINGHWWNRRKRPEAPDLRTILDTIRSLTKPDEEMGWQPIETAPLDGSEVMLWIGHAEFGYFWRNEMWLANSNEVQPTHWMPLPSPPAISVIGE